jgi:hypothetical protein
MAHFQARPALGKSRLKEHAIEPRFPAEKPIDED